MPIDVCVFERGSRWILSWEPESISEVFLERRPAVKAAIGIARQAGVNVSFFFENGKRISLLPDPGECDHPRIVSYIQSGPTGRDKLSASLARAIERTAEE